jgi:hypothetical protein
MKASNFKDVKKGGRIAQKTAGTSPSGRPAANMGGGGRGEFAVQTAGTVAGGLSKAPETGYRQESAK